MDRRLTTILAADVVGYSRLMGMDEVGTLAALKAHRRELVDAKIAEHQGRIVKLTGDGMLVEFSSVVIAVSCACEIQRGMHDRNTSIPPDRRIEFRIGINVGDVIVDGDDLYGDGVNRRSSQTGWHQRHIKNSVMRLQKIVWTCNRAVTADFNGISN